MTRAPPTCLVLMKRVNSAATVFPPSSFLRMSLSLHRANITYTTPSKNACLGVETPGVEKRGPEAYRGYNAKSVTPACNLLASRHIAVRAVPGMCVHGVGRGCYAALGPVHAKKSPSPPQKISLVAFEKTKRKVRGKKITKSTKGGSGHALVATKAGATVLLLI